MDDEKDRFGEKMKLVERAKEDIYFSQQERELIAKLKAKLQKVHEQGNNIPCPKCPGHLETHTFDGFFLDRCDQCGGIWMDNGELERVIKKATSSGLVTA